MKKIFIVYNNKQQSDAEDSYRWVEEEHISFHATEEGAKTKVDELRAEQVNIHKYYIDYYTTHNDASSAKSHEKLIKELELNRSAYEEGDGSDTTLPIYAYKSVELQD